MLNLKRWVKLLLKALSNFKFEYGAIINSQLSSITQNAQANEKEQIVNQTVDNLEVQPIDIYETSLLPPEIINKIMFQLYLVSRNLGIHDTLDETVDVGKLKIQFLSYFKFVNKSYETFAQIFKDDVGDTELYDIPDMFQKIIFESTVNSFGLSKPERYFPYFIHDFAKLIFKIHNGGGDSQAEIKNYLSNVGKYIKFKGRYCSIISFYPELCMIQVFTQDELDEKKDWVMNAISKNLSTGNYPKERVIDACLNILGCMNFSDETFKNYVRVMISLISRIQHIDFYNIQNNDPRNDELLNKFFSMDVSPNPFFYNIDEETANMHVEMIEFLQNYSPELMGIYALTIAHTPAIMNFLYKNLSNSIDGDEKITRLTKSLRADKLSRVKKQIDKARQFIVFLSQIPQREVQNFYEIYGEFLYDLIYESDPKIINGIIKRKALFKVFQSLVLENPIPVIKVDSFERADRDITKGIVNPILVSNLLAKLGQSKNDIDSTNKLISLMRLRRRILPNVTEQIKRKIFSLINHQSSGRLTFLRELVQNSLNAYGEAEIDDSEKEIKVSTITEIHFGNNMFLAVSVEDKGGMTLNNFLTKFLKPHASGWSKEISNLRGYFGQGVFTYFREASSVKVKFSNGEECYEAILRPLRNPNTNQIEDIELSELQEVSDKYKGVKITLLLKSDHPNVESAQIEAALISQAEVIDPSEARITFNGKQINYKKEVIFNSNGVGFYVSKNFDPKLTTKGLRVSGTNIFTNIPPIYRKMCDEAGISVDIANVRLLDSRDGIANYNTISPEINRAIQLGYIRSFVHSLLINGTTQLLPYDIIYRIDKYTKVLPIEVRKRMFSEYKALIENTPVNLDIYDDFYNAILAHISPTIHVGDQLMSVLDIVNTIKDDRLFIDQIPNEYQKAFEMVDTSHLEQRKKLKIKLLNEILPTESVYYALGSTIKALIESVNKQYNIQIGTKESFEINVNQTILAYIVRNKNVIH